MLFLLVWGDSPVPHCPLPRDLWSPGRFPPGLLLVLGVEEEWGSARAAPGLTTSRCGNPRLFGGTCPPKPTELLGISKRIRLPGAPLSGFLAPQNMRFLIPARKRPFALPSAHQEFLRDLGLSSFLSSAFKNVSPLSLSCYWRRVLPCRVLHMLVARGPAPLCLVQGELAQWVEGVFPKVVPTRCWQ